LLQKELVQQAHRITTIAASCTADTTAQASKSGILAILVSNQSATDCYIRPLQKIAQIGKYSKTTNIYKDILF